MRWITLDAVETALLITSFVAVMMLLIEYLNVLTMGAWRLRLSSHRWGQYLLAALLGATPGCLGAFVVVAMYSHGALTLGALITAMIAASGDEAFVMLALIPRQALLIMAILVITGIAVGVLVDWLSGNRRTSRPADCLALHLRQECACVPRGQLLRQWRECTAARGALTISLALFLAALAAGRLGPAGWNWIRVSLVLTSAIALLIAATVPDHFLEEHLWRHVVKRHAPRVFLWTLGALIAMQLLTSVLHLRTLSQEGKWGLLVAACLIGLIPESGPHLIFVTLYAGSALPFSVLLASTVVQDGRGMLPMLAHSRREFLLVKAVNFVTGLGLGGLAMAAGY
ncbi:MAG: arsenic efflux protein [Bryobacterales bacterium]|nr:arsenic efflux protein [Bryobacterales bacterium]